jgi:hypothetical protein
MLEVEDKACHRTVVTQTTPGFLEVWYAHHQWQASHCSVVHGISKKNQRIKNFCVPSVNAIT